MVRTGKKEIINTLNNMHNKNRQKAKEQHFHFLFISTNGIFELIIYPESTNCISYNNQVSVINYDIKFFWSNYHIVNKNTHKDL